MIMPVMIKTFEAPPVCEKEILRYSGCAKAEASIAELMKSCVEEAKPYLSYKVCWCEADVFVTNGICDFGFFRVDSRHLAKTLSGCKRAMIFAATVGAELDRLISKYSVVSPSKAVMLQSFGAERIEALCDTFCSFYETANNVRLTRRFSAGYGDLPLETQKDVFRVLDCSKNIGVYLNDSLVMTPSKSVTAFVGIPESAEDINIEFSKCSQCEKYDCQYRR